MSAIDKTFYKDFGVSYNKPTIENARNNSDIILNDWQAINFGPATKESDVIQNFAGSYQIKITKENTAFNFAEKFKEYLQNSNFKDITFNFQTFLDNSSNEIGKLIYERIQNFLNNYINVDCCQYKALLSYYNINNIEITNFLNKTLPERLEYLINIFSVSKLYFKNNFYTMNINDSTITDYIESQFISSENMDSVDFNAALKETNKLMNIRYFGDFYQSVVYPIIRNELYTNYDNKEVSDFVISTTEGVYDNCIKGDTSKYIYLTIISSILSEDCLNKLASDAAYNIMAEFGFNPTNNLTSALIKYFIFILNNVPSYEFIDDELPKLNILSAELYFSEEDYLALNETIFNLNTSFNFSQPTYQDIFNIIEYFMVKREEVLRLFRIRLTAQKLTNICSTICRLREEIKTIRVKDSKMGTAALIEELICDYIYRQLTTKVGYKNQSKVPNTLYELEQVLTNDTELNKKIKEVYNNEQENIGILFDSKLKTLKEITSSLNCEIIEYIDTTPSYLNINPEPGVITVKETYNITKTIYPAYITVNGVSVYADYDDYNKITFDSFDDIYQRVKPDDENKSKKHYYIENKEVEINELKQPVFDPTGINKIYYCPSTENKFIEAKLFSKATYLENYNMYAISEQIGVGDNREIKTKLLDFDQNKITKEYYERIVASDNSVIMEFSTKKFKLNPNDPEIPLDVTIGGDDHHLILETPAGFKDYATGDLLIAKSSDTPTGFVDNKGNYFQEINNPDNPEETAEKWFIDKNNIIYHPYPKYAPNTIINLYLANPILYIRTADTVKSYYVKGTGTGASAYYNIDTGAHPASAGTIEETVYGLMTSTKDALTAYPINYMLNDNTYIIMDYDVDLKSAQISEIANNVYLKYSTGIIIDKDTNYYQLRTGEKFTLDNDPNEVLTFSASKQLTNSNGVVLNDYSANLDKFYNIENAQTAIEQKERETSKVLNGNEAFWNTLSVTTLYEDKTVEEERDIIKFYKQIGLINDNLSDKYKITTEDSKEELTIEWMIAREKIIDQLKQIWTANAQHTWYNPILDDKRLEEGKISEAHIEKLKEADMMYHSNLGQSFIKNTDIVLNKSLVNLENWENNTIAVHPFIWNLVEQIYDQYIELYTISLYGETILSKIYNNTRIWNQPQIGAIDNDGLFSFTADAAAAHLIDYWKEYSKSFFGYSTEYEMSDNKMLDGSLSRYLDFDGPFNYEALQDIVISIWPADNTITNNSIKNKNLSKYYIEIDE